MFVEMIILCACAQIAKIEAIQNLEFGRFFYLLIFISTIIIIL